MDLGDDTVIIIRGIFTELSIFVNQRIDQIPLCFSEELFNNLIIKEFGGAINTHGSEVNVGVEFGFKGLLQFFFINVDVEDFTRRFSDFSPESVFHVIGGVWLTS